MPPTIMPSFNPLFGKPRQLCDLIRDGRSDSVQVVGSSLIKAQPFLFHAFRVPHCHVCDALIEKRHVKATWRRYCETM